MCVHARDDDNLDVLGSVPATRARRDTLSLRRVLSQAVAHATTLPARVPSVERHAQTLAVRLGLEVPFLRALAREIRRALEERTGWRWRRRWRGTARAAVVVRSERTRRVWNASARRRVALVLPCDATARQRSLEFELEKALIVVLRLQGKSQRGSSNGACTMSVHV
jgi:hypothetical protein